MPTTYEVTVVPTNEPYDSDDPRWLDQIADLVEELRRGPSRCRTAASPRPG
jgi:hypothetical protein